MKFATVVLDVDSTVAGIEGIDWLAARRGPAIAAEVARLTDAAMNGVVPLEEVYSRRLAAIQPTEQDVGALAEAYQNAVAPGAPEVIARLRAASVRVVLVSGGIRQAIAPLAAWLGVPESGLFAVTLTFDGNGRFAGVNPTPLTLADGKARVVRELDAARPLLAVGDGVTDAAMRTAADAFGAFTGFVRRDAVVRAADYEFTHFADIERVVIPN